MVANHSDRRVVGGRALLQRRLVHKQFKNAGTGRGWNDTGCHMVSNHSERRVGGGRALRQRRYIYEKM